MTEFVLKKELKLLLHGCNFILHRPTWPDETSPVKSGFFWWLPLKHSFYISMTTHQDTSDISPLSLSGYKRLRIMNHIFVAAAGEHLSR